MQNNSFRYKLLLPGVLLIIVSCENNVQTTTYSVEELKDNDTIFETISKQCEMGEIPLDSANCENLKKAQLLRAW